ncbi:GNAT family N-acetyltransferase [Agromyces sp. SYSU T00194]|uniref:GNAT family N-acetyltransferase n=1 Tax=Agromyces chitinivorans TaxID=3158560 RepID=UPI0033931FE5
MESKPRRVERRPYYRASNRLLAERAVALPALRVLRDDDLRALAEVHLPALRGTVDDEEDTLEQLVDDYRGGTTGDWGTPLRDRWLVTEDDRGIAAAVLTTHWRGTPFIALVVTRLDAQRRGLASALIAEVAARSLARGEPELALIVTRGNPALDLYERLGFVEADRPDA